MKIFKGWIGNRPVYFIRKEGETKCIDCLVKDEYVIANTGLSLQWLIDEQKFTESCWLELLVVTGITKGQMEKMFREVWSSGCYPRPDKEYS